MTFLRDTVALRVALCYAALGFGWIALSDLLVFRESAGASSRLAQLQAYQGLLFVVATAVVLYVLIRRGTRQLTTAQAALHEREELFHAVFEQSMDALFVLDDAGAFVDANGAGLQLLGVTKDALRRRRFPDFVPADAHEEARRGWDVLAGTGELRGEIDLAREDGERRCVEFRVRHGILPGRHLAIVRDLAQQRALEDQLRQAQRMESLGRLAGGVAHDFNNILTAILGHAEMIVDDLPPESPLRQDLGEIRSAARRAVALTRQLLAFSRRQVLSPRVVDLGEVVRGLEPMLRRVIGEDIVLGIVAGRGLAVRADPSQLEQVVVNLALNARDAMPGGGQLAVSVAGETVSAEQAAGDAELVPGPFAVATVADTGQGMSPEVLAHIFEPFYTTKERGRGSGLGLATVYGIVNQSGGFIRVQSQPGRGSTFRIFLPLVEAVAETPAPQAESPPAGGHETVLLVEDEDAVRGLMRRALEARGYRVLAAPGGAAALELAAKHGGAVDVLVTDVVMPGMSGPQLADALRRFRPRLRVVFVSGYAEDALGQRGLADRDALFVAKPFTADALAAQVRRVLDGAPK